MILQKHFSQFSKSLKKNQVEKQGKEKETLKKKIKNKWKKKPGKAKKTI